jgi:flagellar protein FliO/FliZ
MSAEDLLRYGLALVAVIALVFAAAAVYRYLLPSGPRIPRVARKDRRLRVIEMLPIDGRRQLVLVRRDQTEHLLLLFAERGLVVERNIGAPPPAAAAPPDLHSEPEG